METKGMQQAIQGRDDMCGMELWHTRIFLGLVPDVALPAQEPNRQRNSERGRRTRTSSVSPRESLRICATRAEFALGTFVRLEVGSSRPTKELPYLERTRVHCTRCRDDDRSRADFVARRRLFLRHYFELAEPSQAENSSAPQADEPDHRSLRGPL